jgi:hypothetical protein
LGKDGFDINSNNQTRFTITEKPPTTKPKNTPCLFPSWVVWFKFSLTFDLEIIKGKIKIDEICGILCEDMRPSTN